jgi:hypothetical protein
MPRQKMQNSFLHFICGFIGKSNGEDGVSCDTTVDKVGNTMGNGFCFSCSRSGDDKERSFSVEDGLFLLRIE